jgi:hypothetical protein
MAAQPNVAGMARRLYVADGAGLASWGYGVPIRDGAQWAWLLFGGVVLGFGMIGYSPLHAWVQTKDRKAN